MTKLKFVAKNLKCLISIQYPANHKTFQPKHFGQKKKKKNQAGPKKPKGKKPTVADKVLELPMKLPPSPMKLNGDAQSSSIARL